MYLGTYKNYILSFTFNSNGNLVLCAKGMQQGSLEFQREKQWLFSLELDSPLLEANRRYEALMAG